MGRRRRLITKSLNACPPWWPIFRWTQTAAPPSSRGAANFMRLKAACIVLAGLVSQNVWANRPEVVIDPGGVPPTAIRVINEAVEAITRLAEDQDGGEVERLRRRAHQASVSALETQGYFSAKVTLEVGQDEFGETWDITIEPGPRTEITDVDLRFTGHIERPEFEPRVAMLRDTWPLTKGMPFTNEAWHRAKVNLLDEVSRKDFYFARLTSSQATTAP